MKVIVTISDALACYKELTHTGNLPQFKIRTVELDLPDIEISKHEQLESINFKLNPKEGEQL